MIQQTQISQGPAAVRARDATAVANGLIAKANQFRKLFGPDSKAAPGLDHAATVLLALLRERDKLSAMSEAAMIARDGAGILGTSPAETIVMLDEDNQQLRAENDRLIQAVAHLEETEAARAAHAALYPST
tara:strand:+ start:16884 stop:17276 length:393 start_codon:yes stop_codon:yes gene_type:complete